MGSHGLELAEKKLLLVLVPAVLPEQQDRADEAPPDPVAAPVSAVVSGQSLELGSGIADAVRAADHLLVDDLPSRCVDHLDPHVLEWVGVVAAIACFDEQPVIEHELLDAQVGHLGGVGQADPAVATSAIAIAPRPLRGCLASHERQLDRYELAEFTLVDLAGTAQVRAVRLADHPASVIVFGDEVDDGERLRAEEQGLVSDPRVLAAEVQCLRVPEHLAPVSVCHVLQLAHYPHTVRDGEGVFVAVTLELANRGRSGPVGLAPAVQLEVVAGQSGHLLCAVTDILNETTAIPLSRVLTQRN